MTRGPRKARAVGLSRERILSETIKYLRAHPHEQLTMARAGAAVNATSMAIYRHFRDQADLADAILEVVLDDVGKDIPADAGWQDQVGAWMRAVYGRLVATPQCVHMIATIDGPSLPWVRASVSLTTCLSGCGLNGRNLAEIVFWIGATVAGFAQQTLATPLNRQIEGTLSTFASLEPEEAEILAPLMGEIPRIFSRSLEIMIERTLASAEVLVAQSTQHARAPLRPLGTKRAAVSRASKRVR
jgi:AcrR family transcriptional regulator